MPYFDLHLLKERMSQVSSHDFYRCVGLACLLCMAASVPVTVRAVDTFWPRALPNQHVQLAKPALGLLLDTIPGYSVSIVRAAADHERDEVTNTYDWDGHPASGADWRGIKQDTGYFLGYQFAAIGILYVAPEEISGWSDEQKDDRDFDKWKDNAGNPQWDEDDWWINYLLHPYWGGAYYIRAQERGFDRGQSFLYSALLSTLYEFGAEALFEAPSYQDLIVTPVAGYLLGHYLFTPLRERIRAQRGEPDWAGKTLLFLTDPLGVVNVTTDRILGVRTDIALQLVPMLSSTRWAVPGQAPYRQHDDLPETDVLQGWGLQLRMAW